MSSVGSVSFWQQDQNYWNRAQQDDQSFSQLQSETGDLFGTSSTLAAGLASIANGEALNRTDDALSAAIQSALQSEASGASGGSSSSSTATSSSSSSSASPSSSTAAAANAQPAQPTPAVGTGTVPLTTSTTLSSLGIIKGGAITVTDGNNVTTYTSTGHDTIGNLINGINSNAPNTAYVTASLSANGDLVITAKNNTDTVTVGGTYAANIGFGTGNVTFAPVNPQSTLGSATSSTLASLSSIAGSLTSSSSGISSSSGSSSGTASSSGSTVSLTPTATLFNASLALQSGSSALTLLSTNGASGSLVNMLA